MKTIISKIRAHCVLRLPEMGLLLILGAALVVRMCGIWFDLPELSHPDEAHEVNRALRLGLGSFELRIGKGGYFYLLFVEYGIYFVALKFLGVVNSANDFMMMFVRDPSNFWLIGRGTTAILGTLNVWLTYQLGKRCYSESVGIVAACFLAFCSVDAVHAHFITVDIPMTTCVLASLYFAIGLFETGRMRDYVLAGLFGSLAVMTKISAAPVVVAIALAHILRRQSPDREATRQPFFSKGILVCGIVFIVVYALGEPAIVVTPLRAVDSMTSTITAETPATERDSIDVNKWAFYGSRLPTAIGWPLCVLTLLGVGLQVVRPSGKQIVLLAFPLLLSLALVFAPGSRAGTRYVLPILPYAFLFAAAFILTVVERLPCSKTLRAIVAGIVVCAICVPRAHVIVQDDLALCRPGTPLLARDWLHENVHGGTKILVLGYPGGRNGRVMCPLQDTSENMREFANELESESPMGATFTRLQADVQTGIEYDLTVIQPDQQWLTLGEVKNLRIPFIVVPREDFNGIPGIDKTRIRAEKTGRKRFYEALQEDPDVRLRHKETPAYINVDDSLMRDRQMEIYEIIQPEHALSLHRRPS